MRFCNFAFKGNQTIPSYALFAGSECYIGKRAQNQVTKDPSNTIFDIKRLIGQPFDEAVIKSVINNYPFKVVLNESGASNVQVNLMGGIKKFSAEEILSMFLSKMKENAEEHLGKRVQNAVISVPACFNDAQVIS